MTDRLHVCYFANFLVVKLLTAITFVWYQATHTQLLVLVLNYNMPESCLNCLLIPVSTLTITSSAHPDATCSQLRIYVGVLQEVGRSESLDLVLGSDMNLVTVIAVHNLDKTTQVISHGMTQISS